jgi:phosphate starvation-inducible membrane PsiE
MARVNRKQNSMTSKSIIFMYLRASKKRRYDESKDDILIFFIMMSFLVLIASILSSK